MTPICISILLSLARFLLFFRGGPGGDMKIVISDFSFMILPIVPLIRLGSFSCVRRYLGKGT